MASKSKEQASFGEKDECSGCFYNRPMQAWGETFDACFYGHDTGKKLYGDGGYCSGFEDKETQLEMEIEMKV